MGQLESLTSLQRSIMTPKCFLNIVQTRTNPHKTFSYLTGYKRRKWMCGIHFVLEHYDKKSLIMKN